ncbi:hypothetical protein SAMN02745124_01204 [Desulfofustis glycolicus DSM 9705]|uniref:Uncharacterized protein n=1 Tax=Desulfofustis glycolicus DSM 9705 TaxID=1121409 RepID=A0A1M5UJC8_9BACT|nr:hypothetical protein SAMN02745124_01204 [Desulfofustis glycolicus DSM 9705]
MHSCDHPSSLQPDEGLAYCCSCCMKPMPFMRSHFEHFASVPAPKGPIAIVPLQDVCIANNLFLRGKMKDDCHQVR